MPIVSANTENSSTLCARQSIACTINLEEIYELSRRFAIYSRLSITRSLHISCTELNMPIQIAQQTYVNSRFFVAIYASNISSCLHMYSISPIRIGSTSISSSRALSLQIRFR